ncbi:MAG: VCBS repeat-containing protein [Planctomycetes bacterium]|nr:VCBS repeat-containing protein [Planctomycetota bacterium]
MRSLAPLVPFVAVAALAAQEVGITFHPRQQYELPETQPAGTAVADVDNDGDLDLLFALYAGSNSGGDKVGILRNDGAGDFSDSIEVLVGRQPLGLTVADLDGDFDLDFAVTLYVAYALPEYNAARVFLNDGHGVFTAGSWLANVGSFPIAIANADVDEDGHVDLLIAHNHGQPVRLFRGVGSGLFAAGTNVANTGGSLNGIQCADLDGDGHVDLVLHALGAPYVRFGDGRGAFAVRSGFALPSGLMVVRAVDLDEDGILDLLGANGSVVTAHLGIGGARFAFAHAMNAGCVTGLPDTGDFNGDGIPDFAATCPEFFASAIAYAPGNGHGSFRAAARVGTGGFPDGTEPLATMTGDFDGDGFDDVAAPCRNLGQTPYVQVFLALSNANGWTFLGLGHGGANGTPLLRGRGELTQGTALALETSHAAPHAPLAIVIGFARQDLPLLDGTLVPTIDLLAAGLVADANGRATFTATWPSGTPAGTSLWLQSWILDPTSSAGLASSNGLRGTGR